MLSKKHLELVAYRFFLRSTKYNKPYIKIVFSTKAKYYFFCLPINQLLSSIYYVSIYYLLAIIY
jgi:hypothetical protein